jgi:hypothetical protein
VICLWLLVMGILLIRRTDEGVSVSDRGYVTEIQA